MKIKMPIRRDIFGYAFLIFYLFLIIEISKIKYDNSFWKKIFYNTFFLLFFYIGVPVFAYFKILSSNIFTFLGEKTLTEKKELHGNFFYTSEGFTYNERSILSKNVVTGIRWKEIDRIILFKDDNIMIDTSYMEISTNSIKLVFSEDTEGWHKFLEKLTVALEIKDVELKTYKLLFGPTNKVLIYEQAHT